MKHCTHTCFRLVIVMGIVGFAVSSNVAQGQATETKPTVQPIPDTMKAYTEQIPESDLDFKMTPIPGGKFLMGSPEDEEGRNDDEGPQIEVEIKPFWMATHELTWDIYDFFCFSYDVKRAAEAERIGKPFTRTEMDKLADAVTRPTPPYVDMTFGYGHDGYPAICMTAHSAEKFCEWISAKTGKKYRLPTEAEWEWACRAGTADPRFFEAGEIDDYAWYFENSNEKPQPIGEKKPNPWGLYDILGNVSEWCADKYAEDYFQQVADSKKLVNPILQSDSVWHAVRGGSWNDDAEFIRAATRRGAEEDWSIQDPQEPKSIWWHTDAHWVGIRLVRSLEEDAK